MSRGGGEGAGGGLRRRRRRRRKRRFFFLFVAYFPSSATRLSRGRVPRLTFDNFTCYHTETAGKP